MGINPDHLRDYVIVPALRRMGESYLSDDAVELLLMIAAHESHLGTYLKQTKGPALGIYQMEPFTFNDILDNYVAYKPNLQYIVQPFVYSTVIPEHLLVHDLQFATIMARIHLLRDRYALPSHTDTVAMAKYAKRVWNTEAGKATSNDYLRAYERLVEGSW